MADGVAGIMSYRLILQRRLGLTHVGKVMTKWVEILNIIYIYC